VILVRLPGQSRVFYRTPWRSNLVCMLFVSLFSAIAPISWVGHMTSIGTPFAFVAVCGGVPIMRKTNPGLARPFRTPLVPLVPILSIVVCLAMMFGLG
jgi:APA family basic amino acid/polyamine antiporter